MSFFEDAYWLLFVATLIAGLVIGSGVQLYVNQQTGEEVSFLTEKVQEQFWEMQEITASRDYYKQQWMYCEARG